MFNTNSVLCQYLHKAAIVVTLATETISRANTTMFACQFSKGDNFYDFLFAFLFSMVYTHKGKSFFQGSEFFQLPEMKIAEIANSVDLDEVAHHEPPHLDLHCLPSRFFLILNMI